MKAIRNIVESLESINSEILSNGFDFNKKAKRVSFYEDLEKLLLKYGILEDEADCDGYIRRTNLDAI